MKIKTKSQMLAREGLLRRVPLSLFVALLLQAGSVVWWVSAHEREDAFHAQRLEIVETKQAQIEGAKNEIIERLARLEERLYGITISLERIEKQTSTSRR